MSTFRAGATMLPFLADAAGMSWDRPKAHQARDEHLSRRGNDAPVSRGRGWHELGPAGKLTRLAMITFRAGATMLLLVATAAGAACGGGSRTGLEERPAKAQESSPGGTILFRDAAEETGLVFRHFTGATGEFYLPEIMGSGAALLDYDDDGDLDAYLVQGYFLDPQKTMANARFPPSPGWKPGNRLFRNELIPSGKLQFVDVTERARVGHVGVDMGVATGDYDGDGRIDLYVTAFGPNVLYRNNGDGTFTDKTREAGVEEVRWSSSAAFVDTDRDGDLDLYVANYVAFTTLGNKLCVSPTGERDYCAPKAFGPVPDRFFRNDGKGHFTDATEAAGLDAAVGPGLGVACADIDGDGWTDIYVANDGSANFLWKNRGDGTFEEIALPAGVAFNENGYPQAGMGVAIEDFDGDESADIFVTNLTGEGAVLYHNDGRGNFHDATRERGLFEPTFNYTGFGTEWLDYDGDGTLDIFIANGAVTLVESLLGTPYPFDQKNLLIHGTAGGAKFEDVSAAAGQALQLSEVSRGAAFGDVDNDGDIDILVTNNNGPARLLLNLAGSRMHWLEVKLEATNGDRRGVGARIARLREGRAPVWRHAHTDASYLSAGDVRVHFGLGASAEPQRLMVVWPNGEKEVWDRIAPDALATLRQGTGHRPDASSR